MEITVEPDYEEMHDERNYQVWSWPFAAYIAIWQFLLNDVETNGRIIFNLAAFSKQILCPAQKKDICIGANIEKYSKFKTIGTLTSTVSEYVLMNLRVGTYHHQRPLN